MAAVQRKLVHKQFNSPIGLYSQQNVKETLDRELKAFGTDGIEIDEQIAKPLNLANSAVLRAVEEEEQQMKCGYKRVAWPPVSEERIVREYTPQPQPSQEAYYNQQHQQPRAASQGPTHKNVPPRQPSPYPHNNQPKQQTNFKAQSFEAQPNQQQPIQYTQAQFKRQPSYEGGKTVTIPLSYQQPEFHQNQQQHNLPQIQQEYNAQYQQQQHHQHHQQQYNGDSFSPANSWKPIRPPVAKAHSQYQTLNSSSNYPQQPSSDHYPVHNQHQQQQFQRPVANQYQQQAPLQQQHQPPSSNWAQQQQQPNQYQNSHQYQEQHHQQQLYQNQNSFSQQPQANQYQQQQFKPQYNSYSQPHQQPHYQSTNSQDQPDQYTQQPHREQSLPQDYRGGSPGIITLRKEAPMSQKPAPVFTSQPAAVSYQGGSNMRGDLKWPPPEYKEAAAKENEERRKLALGPVCRPRKVNRDYTGFFAKNALNCYYPSYKVPPGTQHMY